MTEFNFADNEHLNAFCQELGLALRRIAHQNQPKVVVELPKPTEKKVQNRSFGSEDAGED